MSLKRTRSTLEVGSPATGFLSDVLVKVGENVEVGAIVDKSRKDIW